MTDEFSDSLKAIGAPPAIKKKLIALQRKTARRLKAIRTANDREAKKFLLKFFDKKNRTWKVQGAKVEFQRMMDRRWKIHYRLVKIKAEKKEPEFDSP